MSKKKLDTFSPHLRLVGHSLREVVHRHIVAELEAEFGRLLPRLLHQRTAVRGDACVAHVALDC